MDDIIQLLNLFAPLFSWRVWPQARLLLVGALLTPSARTVASVLRTMGRSGEADFTTYHRVLNRAVWSARYGSRILLGVLIETFVPKDAAVVLGGDDTLERRGGRRIGGRGCYRDGVRSTGRHTVRCFGLKWVSLMVLVRLPWSRRVWALPFLTVLCPASSSSSGRRPKTSVDWMRQMLVQTRRWLPGRRLVLVVDGAYAALSLAWGCQKQGVGLVSRLRWDARLFHPPAARRPGQRGPTPQKGSRQRPLRRWATRRDTPWQTQTLAWYGGKPKTRWLFSRTALWHRSGQKPLPIRFVIVRDPQGQHPDAVFFSTDVDAAPKQIVEWAVMRWAVETTFQESRKHLGLETQRQWSDKAIQRTTPCLLGLFSIVCWLTETMRQGKEIPMQTTAWYPKDTPTFSDCVYGVRQHLWTHIISKHSIPTKDHPLLPPQIMDLLATYPRPKAA